jgi:hypothetical protein
MAITSSLENAAGGGAAGRGKKTGLPAKNLMAERRRRKKLNDRLYMLRSVVPKISKVMNVLSTLLYHLQPFCLRHHSSTAYLYFSLLPFPNSGFSRDYSIRDTVELF